MFDGPITGEGGCIPVYMIDYQWHIEKECCPLATKKEHEADCDVDDIFWKDKLQTEISGISSKYTVRFETTVSTLLHGKALKSVNFVLSEFSQIASLN